MIQKIQNILKRSGGWGIRWNSLQLKFLWYFTLSILFAFIAHLTVSLPIEAWLKNKNAEEMEKQKIYSEKIADNLVFPLTGMSAAEAIEYLEEYDEEHNASIVLINSNGMLIYSDLFEFTFLDDNNLGYPIPYINRPVKLREGTGFLIYQSVPTVNSIFFKIKSILSIFSVLIFFISFYLQSKNILNDIDYINSKVDLLIGGNLSVKIELKRDDELGHLSRNINRMGDSINAMLEEKRKTEQKSRKLISGISHDLKTPLTSLIGYLNLLKDPVTDRLTEKERIQYIKICHNQSLRLSTLISDLFLYVKYTDTSLKLSRTVFSFKDLTEQVLEEHSELIKRHGITLNYQTNFNNYDVSGDPEHLARVLNNLLGNLVQYCDGKKEAKLSLFRDQDLVAIELSNTAEILKGKDPEILFGRLVRGDESRGQYGGSGLGLSICREIVGLHSGTINAEIKGDCFVIRMELPFSEHG